MATKANDPCREKAAVDEPIFTLRGQDKLAPALVALWAELAQLNGAGKDKVASAAGIALDMSVWQAEHGGGKFPD